MKTRSVLFMFTLSLIFLCKGIVVAQETTELFNEAYPELDKELKFSPTVKTLDNKLKNDYRNLLTKLDNGIDDLVAMEIGALTDENTKVFNYKSIRKVKGLDKLKVLIQDKKSEVKAYMGSRTKYGADSVECIRNIALLQQAIKMKNWNTAYTHWNVLFHFYPRASRTPYSKGINIVEFKFKNEKDAVVKEKWIDTLMLVYDQRIQYFGNSKKYPKGYILGRKATTLLKYRKTAVETAHGIFKESVKLQGVKSEDAVLLTYMQASDGMSRSEKMEPADYVDTYTQISDLLNKRIKIAKDKKRAQQAINGVDAIFGQNPNSTCEVLVPAYEKKFKANPEDLELMKKIIKILVSKNCTESELFYNVAVEIVKKEPSSIAYYSLAMKAAKKKEYDVASGFLDKAIQLETEDTLQAKYYYKLAQIKNETGKKVLAKTHALKAISLKENYGAPYILIATMYASSGCKQLSSPQGELSNVAYWAAVDKLVKARSIDPTMAKAANSMIGTYSRGFPNAEKAFMIGVTKGKKVTVGCWINEVTTVRF